MFREPEEIKADWREAVSAHEERKLRRAELLAVASKLKATHMSWATDVIVAEAKLLIAAVDKEMKKHG